MNIAIVGAGNMGCANAADLTIKGHNVTLIKSSKKMHDVTFENIKNNNNCITLFENGEYKTAFVHKLTRNIEDVSKADIVLIMTQTNYHEEIIQRISPHLKNGQIVLVTPGYFSTAFFLKYARDKQLTIIEGESSTIDCRVDDNGVVRVGFRNVRNPVGVFPVADVPKVIPILESMQQNFVILSSVIEAALHNPNLIVHTVGAIMSIPRIEKTKGDYCMYWEVWTPSVYKILDALDNEKMNLLTYFGFDGTDYFTACKYRNSLDEKTDPRQVFADYASMPTRAKGPTTVDSRYISEDVPQGLVMLESLSKHCGLKTPVCTSLIEIASAALGRDLRKEGRTTDRLCDENIGMIFADSRKQY